MGRATWLLGGLTCVLVGGFSRPATAQSAWTDRVRVSVSAGVQLDSGALSENITLAKYVEPAPLRAELAGASVPLLDVGALVRLAGNLGASVSISYLTTKQDAEVDAEIPHPFFFNQLRPISGTASDLEHVERAVHADVVYMIASDGIDLALFGGASFLQVEKDLIVDVLFTEQYPYDTATFSSAVVGRASSRSTGYNVGADVTWKVTRRFGLGGLVRFTRARAAFEADGVDFGKADVGGLQAAGGIRLIF